MGASGECVLKCMREGCRVSEINEVKEIKEQKKRERKAHPSLVGRGVGENASRVVRAASYLAWIKCPRRFCW